MKEKVLTVLSALLALAAGGLLAKAERDRPKAPASAKAITNSIGMKLVLIPAGKFLMGSPQTEKDRDGDEMRHEVTISRPFYMGAYEVTQEQFQKVMKP